MAAQKDLDIAYMTCAYAVAKLSHATRRKVGAIMVSPRGGIIAEGVNGMPSGFDNSCEKLEVIWPHSGCLLPVAKYGEIVTKDACLHAESNAITKVARSTNSSVGATLYCTLSPCFECAKLIIQAGIKRVVFSEQYPYPGHSGPVRHIGLDLLREAKIQVDNLPLQSHHVTDEEFVLQDEGRLHDDESKWRQA